MATKGDGKGKVIVRGFWTDVFTLLFLEWMTNKDLLYSAGNSAHLAAWMGEELGENGYMCMHGQVTLLCT